MTLLAGNPRLAILREKHMVRFEEIKVGHFFYWGGQQLMKTQEILCHLEDCHEPRRNSVKFGEGSHHYFKPDERVKLHRDT